MRLFILLAVMSFAPSLFAGAGFCTGNDFLKYDRRYQLGYVSGATDALTAIDTKTDRCLGTGPVLGQVADTLKLHFENNPQYRHLSCAEELKTAINKAWKCK